MYETKSFHTSSRALVDPPAGSNEPEEKGLHGEQNEHLKHKPADAPDKGKGNASDEPHLPSQSQSPKPTATGTGTRAFSTSLSRTVTSPPGGYAKAIPPEPANAGYVSCPAYSLPLSRSEIPLAHTPSPTQDAPPEALPSHLDSAYQEKDPSAIRPIERSAAPSSENVQPNAEIG